MRQLTIACGIILMCLCLWSDAEAWPVHGRVNQSGQNVVDDNGVLVVDGSAVQVVAP